MLPEKLYDRVTFSHNSGGMPTDRYDVHCHPMYEVYVLLAGRVSFLVEGAPWAMGPGGLLLLRTGAVHGVKPDAPAPYERYTLHFPADTLPVQARAGLLEPFHRAAPFYPDAGPLLACLRALEECSLLREPMRSAAYYGRFLSLIGQLGLLSRETRPCLPERASVARAIAYIEAHLDGDLSLDALAGQVFLSKNQLGRQFLQATGTSVGLYVRRKRVARADELRASGVPASDAALSAGFRDYSTYYRARKRLL